MTETAKERLIRAYHEGADAWLRSEPATWNRYGATTEEGRAWASGWADGRDGTLWKRHPFPADTAAHADYRKSEGTQ